jgi:hypothetical protein
VDFTDLPIDSRYIRGKVNTLVACLMIFKFSNRLLNYCSGSTWLSIFVCLMPANYFGGIYVRSLVLVF